MNITMKQSKVLDKELQDSKKLLVHRHQRTCKKVPEQYCPVITYDGVTKNPEYKQRPIQGF